MPYVQKLNRGCFFEIHKFRQVGSESFADLFGLYGIWKSIDGATFVDD